MRHALFAFKGRDRCFVGTGANALASLDLRQGGLVWRQALAAGDSILAMALVPKPASVVSLSAQGLRAWRAGDGTLLWDAAMEGAGGSSMLRVLPDVTRDGSSDIAVLAGGKLRVRCLFIGETHAGLVPCLGHDPRFCMPQVVSGASGALVWSLQLPEEWTSMQVAVAAAAEHSALIAVGVQDG